MDISNNSKYTEPFISIITVCRNEVARIELTCESIVNQTYKNYEWIVLDGGSIDGTLNILLKYKKYMNYFRSRIDEGIYPAMNEGIRHSKGEYSIFLNGGDAFHKHTSLTEVVPYLAQKPLILVGGMFHIGGEAIIRHYRKSWYRFRFLFVSAPHQGTFFKTQLLKELKGYDESYKIAGDTDLYLRAIRKGVKIYTMPVMVADFYLGGIGNTNEKIILQETQKIRSKYFSLFEIKSFKTIACLISKIKLPSFPFNFNLKNWFINKNNE